MQKCLVYIEKTKKLESIKQIFSLNFLFFIDELNIMEFFHARQGRTLGCANRSMELDLSKVWASKKI